MTNFGQRVRERREELRMSQEDLARAAGISQSTVAQIEGGRNKGTKHILGLGKALGVRAEWLQGGRGEMTDPTMHKKNITDLSISAPNSDLIVKSQGKTGNTMGLSNTEPGQAIPGRVPLISWDQARTWDPLMTSFKKEDAQTWLACPVEHGLATFCIENNTESMDDGTRRGYGEGDILFIDPGVPAVPDKDILVILPDGKMLFRRLKEDGEGPYLLALNGKRIERWQEGTVVQGVVIFSGISR